MVVENTSKLVSVVVLHISQLDLSVVLDKQITLVSIVDIHISQLDLGVINKILYFKIINLLWT